jgi:hypothetical protein
MVRGVGRTQTARRRELSRRTTAVPQAHQNTEPAWVGKASEQLGIEVKTRHILGFDIISLIAEMTSA